MGRLPSYRLTVLPSYRLTVLPSYRLTGEAATQAAALAAGEKNTGTLQVENARINKRAKATETRSAELNEDLARLHRQFEMLRQSPDKK
jgi:hypothetical protein